MKAKNLTPFPFGALVTSRRPPKPEIVLVLRATYLLGADGSLTLPEGPGDPRTGPDLVAQGPMSSDTYAEDDAQRVGECLYPGDFAHWKPRAEVMLRGTCHAPFGKPVTECPVRFSVGAFTKLLRVVGRRFWSDDRAGAVMSETAPFTKMPLGWANAFGGAGYPTNPAGKGFATRELPNIEHAGQVIQSRKDDLGPAGFGPINPSWPPRAPKLGKEYGERWKKERSPYFSEDFDWGYFNAAPPDQQLEGYLRGDEVVSFQNLHPKAQVIETRLPGLRPRAFLKDEKGRFREVPMRLDTLYADMDEGKLYLTWRGLDAIEQDDKKDAAWALVATEPLVEPPLPAIHYRERLEAFEADPLEIKDRTPADVLAITDEMKARDEARKAGKPVTVYDTPAPDPLTASLRGLFDRMPVAPKGGTAMEASVAAAVSKAIAAAPPKVDMKAEIAKMVVPPKAPRPPAVSLRPGAPPVVGAKILAKAMGRLEALRADLQKRERSAEAKAGLAQLDELKASLEAEPFFKKLLDRPAYVEPGPYKDLSFQDYEGKDLRGVDLTGVRLVDANLAGADLRGVKLVDAKLEAAILSGAELAGADFTGADLTLANLTEAQARGVIFKDATLDRAFLKGADLREAVFDGAKGEAVFLPDADLTGARGRKVSLTRSFAKGVKLAGADFTEASFVRCLFLEAQGRAARFSGALLTRTSFANSDLTGADFTRARGDRSVWLGTILDDADFTYAILPSAFFIEATAQRARFKRTILKDARCYRASFEHADFSESQLMCIDFSKCRLSHVTFADSCLYDAKFLGAAGRGVDFKGANLKRALLEDL